MRAVVLSGGGSKGSYEIGFYKAIRKLRIKYDIVTGTSVGALNGVLMVQKTYYRGLILWSNLNYKKIFDYDNIKYKEEQILNLYKDNLLKGGTDISRLEKTISKVISTKKFFNSSIRYGLITVKVPSFKGIRIIKEDLTENNLKDYLIASSSFFPAFKLKKIDNKYYIDGGFYDNLPINLAIDLGATEVIAVDLDEIGLKRKVKSDIPITYITPQNDIGSFLKFEKNKTRRGIRLGFNDTMKKYNKFEGNKYTFKLGCLDQNFEKNKDLFKKNIFDILNTNSLLNIILESFSFEKILNDDLLLKDKINKLLEELGYLFELDDSYIYNVKKYNRLLIRKYKLFNKNYNNILSNIKFILDDKEKTICFKQLIEKKDDVKLRELIILFPNEFLMTIYLKTIMEG